MKHMTIRDMQDEIRRLAREKDFCILAHSYQSRDIIEIADETGDSFRLARVAQNRKEKNLLVCGVRFMAETAAILCDGKRVFMPVYEAGCPMAEQFSREDLIALKKQYEGYTVVSYINTTAALKTETDVCVTSSSAERIVRALDNDKILFIPDCNLGAYVAERVPEKTFAFVDGGCPVHAAITEEAVLKAKRAHPRALFLVHPECKREVARHADLAGSTADIMRFAHESDAREFIIGTENSIVSHLSYELPGKRFYPLSAHLICADMKLTTLPDILLALQEKGGTEIKLDEDTASKARLPLLRMIEMGG